MHDTPCNNQPPGQTYYMGRSVPACCHGDVFHRGTDHSASNDQQPPHLCLQSDDHGSVPAEKPVCQYAMNHVVGGSLKAVHRDAHHNLCRNHARVWHRLRDGAVRVDRSP